MHATEGGGEGDRRQEEEEERVSSRDVEAVEVRKSGDSLRVYWQKELNRRFFLPLSLHLPLFLSTPLIF